jgi:TRAP-type C4-dicarboxylate transport system permease small subunit
MPTTPKPSLLQTALAIALDLCMGAVYATCVVGAIGIVFAIVLSIVRLVMPSVQDPPNWLLAPFSVVAVVAFTCMPLWYSIRMVMKTHREQVAEYRATTNRCLHCGYSLSGIRRICERCPECGELFKKL